MPARPLVELHCHVDGAARPATLIELARAAGVPLPADTPEELAPYVQAAPAGGSLDAFLATFETFYPALRAPGAMGRLARELVLDMAADGVVHLEARCCPALQAGEAHDAAAVLDEVLAGLADGAAATGITTGAIVCLYRTLPVELNERLVDLALARAGRGVVGVDLAGSESRPGAPCAAAFRRARAGGLPVTVHAGEAAGPASVVEALDLLGATRLGHGVALVRDGALARRAAEAGVTLECCLTSNLATGAVARLDEHPFDELRRAGLRVTLATDDPAVCATRLSREYALAADTWGYDEAQLDALVRTAIDGAFVGPARRAELHALLDAARAARRP